MNEEFIQLLNTYPIRTDNPSAVKQNLVEFI